MKVVERPIAGRRQRQLQPPLNHRIAGAHLDQQLRQGRRAQRLDFLGVEGSLAGHGRR